MSMLCRASVLSWILIAFAAAPSFASDRIAAECPEWFPDLGCEASGRYEGFSAPMSMPYLFEDPFILTGVQAVGIWQELPERSIFEGGHVQVAALQARIALTDRLALIATRDGHVRFKPDIGAMSHESGFADLGLGVKYALVDRPDSGFILTPHLRYEPDAGGHGVFQGMGDGMIVPGVSFGLRTGDFHWIGGLGAQLPLDRDANSTLVHYNLHLGRTFGRVTPFVAFNGIRWTSSGKGTATVHLASGARMSLSEAQDALGAGRFEGFDFANLGSEGVAGDDMITGTLGVRVSLMRGTSVGLAFERPVGGRKDLMKHRVSLMLAIEF